jgi:hypothetical protein
MNLYQEVIIEREFHKPIFPSDSTSPQMYPGKQMIIQGYKNGGMGLHDVEQY